MTILKTKPLKPNQICGLLRWLEENIGIENFQFNHDLRELINGESMDVLSYLADWEAPDIPVWAINNAKEHPVFLQMSEDHAVFYRLYAL